MAYNQKARETNLKKYGHACSFWGKNGTLRTNEELFKKSQKANIDRVEGSKKRILQGLKEAGIEMMTDLTKLNKMYGTFCSYRCLKCGCEFNHIQRYKIPSCPNCKKALRRSKGEDEILAFIKSFYNGKIILNDRTILEGKKIDIFLPELKLGIEFNGIYFHMVNHQDNYAKTVELLKRGIKLIQIFDIQWNCNKDRIKKAIKICIEFGGCIFKDNILSDEKNFYHNDQFPMFENIHASEKISPRRRMASSIKNFKCPKSQSNHFFVDCGASKIEDIEMSKSQYPFVFC